MNIPCDPSLTSATAHCKVFSCELNIKLISCSLLEEEIFFTTAGVVNTFPDSFRKCDPKIIIISILEYVPTHKSEIIDMCFDEECFI